MTTLIIMLALMTAPYLIVRGWSSMTSRRLDARNAAAIGLGLLFTFTGIGHFVETEAMTQMLPSWVPARAPLVYMTGILEFGIAAGFFLPRMRPLTGRIASWMLVLFFPANVYAAINHVPMGEHAWGPTYLLIRAPLQAVILLWIYWHTIRRSETRTTDAAHDREDIMDGHGTAAPPGGA